MDLNDKIRLMRKTSAFLTDIWGADKVYKSLVCGLRVRKTCYEEKIVFVVSKERCYRYSS